MSRLLLAVSTMGWLASCGVEPQPETTGAAAVEATPDEGEGDIAPAEVPASAAPGDSSEDPPHVIRPLDVSAIPDGPARRGYELATDTARLLPDNVGNSLACTNCHLTAGTVPKAAPWVGVTDRYPKYRARSGKVDDIQDRINGCMERSMNGRALERDSEPMLAMVAYMAWLSEGVPDGEHVEGTGMPRISPPETPDPERGRELFQQRCVACHQADGQGVTGPDGRAIYPPLWGERSYNVGAGMARLNTAAAFVKWNMPLGQGGSLSDQEAYDIASYFIFEGRPDFAGKAKDWPKGDKPSDARY